MRQIVKRKEFTLVSRLGLGERRHIVKGHGKLERPGSLQFLQLPRHRLRGPGKRPMHHLLNHRPLSLPPVNLHPVWRDKFDGDDTRGRIRAKKHGVMLNHSHDSTLPKSWSESQPSKARRAAAQQSQLI